MFGVSLPELLIIMAVILIVFGPDRLPEMASRLGKLMADLRRSSDAVRREFYNSVYKPTEEMQQRIDLASRELNSVKYEVEQEIAQLPHEGELPPTAAESEKKEEQKS